MNRIDQHPHLLETNIFYLILGLLFIGTSILARNLDVYLGLIITEYLVVLLPTVVYLKVRGYNLKKVLKLNRLSIVQVVLIPLIVMLIYPVGMFVNAIMMIFLSFFGEIKPPPIPVPQNISQLIISLIIVAVTAGICEEVMFRGMIMKSYERLGIKKAIIISAILFGFFHFNIQNLLGPIFLGLVFGYIVYKTHSILAGMIAHFTNNAIAVIISYFVGRSNYNPGVTSEITQEIALNIPYPLQMFLGAMFIGAIASITGILAYLLIKALPSSEGSPFFNGKIKESTDRREKLTMIKLIPLFFVGLLFLGISVLTIINM